jgi:hypothetical protein
MEAQTSAAAEVVVELVTVVVAHLPEETAAQVL